MKAKKQVTEDFNLALQLSAEEAWKTTTNKIEALETDEVGACCSKNLIDSVTITTSEAITIPTSNDDAVIAQLLQAEFDIEFDEELKRLEQSRNKS